MEFMRVGRTPPSGVWSGALRQTVRLRRRVKKKRALLVWLGGPGSWAGPFWFGLGGQGSWAGPAWLGGAKGPGPGRLGLGGQGSWAGPAWFFIVLI